jgi:hypothetical protein
MTEVGGDGGSDGIGGEHDKARRGGSGLGCRFEEEVGRVAAHDRSESIWPGLVWVEN